jgi:hypothetical protein
VVFGRSEEEPSPEQRLAGVTTAAVPGTDPGDGQTGAPEGMILLLFTILTVAALAFVLVKAEHNAVHDPAAKAARGDINGLDSDSLIRQQNLRKILAKVAASDHPLVNDIRIAPARVDLETADQDGNQQDVSFDPSLKETKNSFGTTTTNSVKASAIDASAPERMARGVAEKSGLSADAIDYVTATYIIENKPTWFLALKEGPAKNRQWVAEPDGRDVRHPGELSTADKQANAHRVAKLKREQMRLQRVLTQRSKCLSKATDALQAARCIQRFQP